MARRAVRCMFGDGGGMLERWVLGIWMMEAQGGAVDWRSQLEANAAEDVRDD